MNELTNKIVRKIELDLNNQHYLKFTTNEGELIYRTEGDCCSETWFADIVGINSLLNSKINKVEKIKTEQVKDSDAEYGQWSIKGYNLNDGRCRQDYDQIYGYKIHTNKGITDIIFRNSSNGYYGGSIIFLDKMYDNKVEFKEITEDYPN